MELTIAHVFYGSASDAPIAREAFTLRPTIVPVTSSLRSVAYIQRVPSLRTTFIYISLL